MTRDAMAELAPAEPAVDRPDRKSLQRALHRVARLRMESLNLYRSLPVAGEFHECRKRIRILDGSNQAGKTLTGIIETARAVTGTDPYGKYPKTGGRMLIVGEDDDHLRDPLWQTLTKPGAFSIIRDEQTGLWRSVRPDPADPAKLDPYDAAYREKWKEAPPILPPRFIRSIAWKDRAKEVPRSVTLITGWSMLWRSSKSEPVRGRQFHAWQFDEEITDEQFLPEVLRGCMRFGGIGWWSATPQTGGAQLFELRQRADRGDADVEAFTFLLEQNPFYLDEEKQSFYEALAPEEREVRFYGKYALLFRRVYPNYDPSGPHGCEPHVIPGNWTRVVALDPATRHCATLLAAIDPDEQHLHVYDAFELNGPAEANAQNWAREVSQREGSRRFELFIIDQQMGKQHPPGAGANVAEQYFAALRAIGVRPRLEGPLGGFYPGTNDVSAREEALRSLMAIRGAGPFAGTPRLRVHRGAVGDLDRQVRLARTDEKGKRYKDRRQPEDLVTDLEYLAAFDPGYHEPERVTDPDVDPVVASLRRKQARRRREPAQSFGSAMELG